MRVCDAESYARRPGEWAIDVRKSSAVSRPLWNPYVPEGPYGGEEALQAYSLLLDVTLLGRNARDGQKRVIEIGKMSGHEGVVDTWDWERARDRMARLRMMCGDGRVALICDRKSACCHAEYLAWRLNNVGAGKGEVPRRPIRFQS